MTTKEAAQYLGISPYYLRNMRHQLHAHDGPKHFVRCELRGKPCFYSKEDLDAWSKSHKWRKSNALSNHT